MRISYLTINVRDIEKSIQFYRDTANLKVLRRFNPGPGEIAFLGNDENDTMLELKQFDNDKKVQLAGFVLAFHVEGNLTELRNKMIQSGYDVSEIIDFNPKPKHFVAHDPDGIVVEFTA